MVRLEMQLSWWWRSTHGALGSVTSWHHTEWATVMPVLGLGRCRREDQKFKVILIQPEINEIFFFSTKEGQVKVWSPRLSIFKIGLELGFDLLALWGSLKTHVDLTCQWAHGGHPTWCSTALSPMPNTESSESSELLWAMARVL